jgi:hypothetical protein
MQSVDTRHEVEGTLGTPTAQRCFDQTQTAQARRHLVEHTDQIDGHNLDLRGQPFAGTRSAASISARPVPQHRSSQAARPLLVKLLLRTSSGLNASSRA